MGFDSILEDFAGEVKEEVFAQRAGLRPVLCTPPHEWALRPSTPGVFAGLVVPAPTFLGAPPQAPAYFLA